MNRNKLPKSVRKYIRREKARIRREVWNFSKREKLISELYQKIFEKPTLPDVPKKERKVKEPKPTKKVKQKEAKSQEKK